jgi:hypothetical protein
VIGEDDAPTVVNPVSLEVGGDDAFILAWGRSNAGLKSRGRQLALSMGLNCFLGLGIMFLAWRNEQKETYVFVRNALGDVVQADARSFLHAGDRRTELEIKGFMRAWVLDAFTWTPLDIEDRLKACLRLVDPGAHAVVKAGLRLSDRKALVDAGTSGRVYDEAESGRGPQVAIVRRTPLEVMVSVERFLVDSRGVTSEAGQLFVRAILKEVPRSSLNPHGLVVADAQISRHL